MSEPKLVAERAIDRSTNQQVGRATLPKKPSEKSANQFKAQNFLLNDKANNLARDNIANKLSSVADGSYPKCSATSGNPCIDTGGYKDKRAYSGSGMAGWKEAGLSGNTNNRLSVGGGATADIFIFGVGASGEVAKRSHGSSVCTDLTACIQLGLGLHIGGGLSMTAGTENIEASKVNASAGGFGNFFSTGGSLNISDGSVSGGKGVYGAGVGVSGGVQACATVSVKCTK